jgi:hypothetical protein
VIKRFRIASAARAPGRGLEAWLWAVGGPSAAPAGVRPARIAACTVLPDPSSEVVCAAIGIEWFDDAGHLDRYESWLQSPPGEGADGRISEAAGEESPVVVADELVMRGADWLDERWRRGGEVLKQMALATRAEGLTPAEFSQRWKSRAGTVATPGGPPVIIPDEARGRAYVQNHPRPKSSGEWVFDAVNEVYFDDPDALRTRIEWFAENMQGQAETDLVSRFAFVAVREQLLG